MKNIIIVLSLSVSMFSAGCKKESPPVEEAPNTPAIENEYEEEVKVPESGSNEENAIHTEVLPLPEKVPEEVVEKPIFIQRVLYTTSDLNIRSGPGTEYEVLGVLKENAKVIIEETEIDEWVYIGNGYVSRNFLTETIPEIIPEDAIYMVNTIYLQGKAISYKNGGMEDGQKVIDESPSLASTWGGVNPWSGEDDKNTHFIAHDFGAFHKLWEIQIGEMLIITNNVGSPTYYKVESIHLVDKYGVNVETGEEMFGKIVEEGESEVVTLQTCKPESVHNWIVKAVQVIP